MLRHNLSNKNHSVHFMQELILPIWGSRYHISTAVYPLKETDVVKCVDSTRKWYYDKEYLNEAIFPIAMPDNDLVFYSR